MGKFITSSRSLVSISSAKSVRKNKVINSSIRLMSDSVKLKFNWPKVI